MQQYTSRGCIIDGICSAGKGAEFMAIDKPPKQQARDPLAVKLKPKRGKSSRKQKQRMALKLDKVRSQSSILNHGS